MLQTCSQDDSAEGQDESKRDACWVVSALEVGSDETRREVLIVRPLKAGLKSLMPLHTLAGRAYYCLLTSQETMGMVAVTWEVPTVQKLPSSPEAARTPRETPRASMTSVALQPPSVNLDRLFTAYTVEVLSKQRPPWVPVKVFDDGSRTYIQFKEDLAFTASPAVFGVHADRTPAIVEFRPYTDPKGGLTYIVQGLFPQLVLSGTDGMEIQITRGIPHAP